MGVLWVTAVGRHWGSSPDHTQDEAVFQNLGRLKGDGESKGTHAAGKALLAFPRAEAEGGGDAG